MPNPIPKLPKETWQKAFAALVEIAIDKGYFDDILRFHLYYNQYDPPAHATDDEANEHYENIYARVDEAFEEIFEIKKGETNYV